MTTNNSSMTGAQLDEKQIFDLAEAEDAKLRAKAGKSYSQGALVRKRFFRHRAPWE